MITSESRLFDGLGLWLEDLTKRNWAGSPGLFLDRDGVVVEDVGYLSQPGEVRLIESAARAIRMANDFGVPVVVVSNQSGVGRGFYTWQNFADVQSEFYRQLGLHGCHVDFVAACAYHRDARPPFSVASHPWRKPNPGMIVNVARKAGIDLKASVLIGDRWSDIEAATSAGLARGILVQTGHGASESQVAPNFAVDGIRIDITANIAGALDLLKRESWP